MVIITSQKFRQYITTQISGEYNMCDRLTVAITGLTIDEYLEIQRNYSTYLKKFKDVFDEVEREYISSIF